MSILRDAASPLLRMKALFFDLIRRNPASPLLRMRALFFDLICRNPAALDLRMRHCFSTSYAGTRLRRSSG
tara:strand:+ start:180 stop:392 length:213 start_codon:yes stop_codon:yes gene_type:complete